MIALGAMHFPTEIAGERHADGDAVDASDSDPSRAHERERFVRQVSIGQASEKIAGLRPRHIEAASALGQAFKRCAFGQWDRAEEP